MTFLPLVERELRVASRKRVTFWMRIIAALVACFIGSGFFALSTIGAIPLSAASLGKGLFHVLIWLCFAAALASGMFLTSDCLSEEKRDGTLGFLFLTDLRGFDVVFGKLMATALRSSYAMLAVLPILAVTLLMGGVTGAHFWQATLALGNALIVSLAAGLLASALSREAQKALASTLLLLVLLAASGPVADLIISQSTGMNFSPRLSLSSPVYLLIMADAWDPWAFWSGLLFNQLVACTLLGITCFLLPRTWQEKVGTRGTLNFNWAHRWKFGGENTRKTLRRKLVDLNPALWLSCRERWQGAGVWLATVPMVGGFILVFGGDADEGSVRSFAWMAWSTLSGAFTLLAYLGITSQAGRFLVEARRTGLLELLLVTPLTANQIVQGQLRGLLRMFAVPLIICLIIQALGAYLVQLRSWNLMSPAIAATPAVLPTNATGAATSGSVNVIASTGPAIATTPDSGLTAAIQWAGVIGMVVGVLTIVANLAALTWVGMWMGLTSKNLNLATLKTLFFVQIIPWFAISFASTLVVSLVLWPRLLAGGASTSTSAVQFMMFWMPLLMAGITALLCLLKDMAFILWARKKLYAEFRTRAVQSLTPFHRSSPPLAAPLVPPPPLTPG